MNRNRYLTLTSISVLAIALILLVAPAAVKAQTTPTITTDKKLYAIQWSDTAKGYVEVEVTVNGLDATKTYRVAVFKLDGPSSLNFVREIGGSSSITVKFTIPPTKDARPIDLAGTWNVTLYEGVNVVAWTNFGIWAINSRELNYGKTLQIWGGGFKPGTTVEIEVYNGGDVTDDLFGETPIKCKVGARGTFSNASVTITDDVLATGTYTVEITSGTLIDGTSVSGDTTLRFVLTDDLIVKILSPEDGSEWSKTDTVPIVVEVLYKDYTPMYGGTVKVTVEDAGGNERVISLRYDPSTLTWKGSFKIFKDNATGSWTITADAEDGFGNTGTDDIGITVNPAILNVQTIVKPPAQVPRTSIAWWVINVTYKSDGAPADITSYTVYVVNATTDAIVGSAFLTRIKAGVYNVTWLVPSTANLGSYRFYIPKDGLKDAYNNVGPEAVVRSDAFLVGAVALKVEAKTDALSYVPGAAVKIIAKITYIDTGIIMSMGTVRANIYNETGHLLTPTPISLSFNPTTRVWEGTWDSTGRPAGRYKVVVMATDLGGNIGEGVTYFYLAGLRVTPSKGTVPPVEYTRFVNITKDMKEWLVTASIFTDPASGKTLGTKVVIEGFYMTPNSKVNVTVNTLSPLAVYTPTKILLARNVPTDSEGRFTIEIVFPTTKRGTYTITVTDAKGVSRSVNFEVIPGMILTPSPVIGSSLVKVIATGLDEGAYSTGLLIDGTDALYSIVLQAWGEWYANVNGTLISDVTGAKPGFIMPVIEPGTYTFTLLIGGDKVSDTVVVANAFKEFNRIISEMAEIKSLLTATNAFIKEVKDGVAVIATDVGVVKADVKALASTLAAVNAAVVEVKDGVAVIKTDVGTVKADVKALADIKAKLDVAVDAANKATEAAGGLMIPIWIAVILSLIAAITSAIAMVRVSKKIAG